VDNNDTVVVFNHGQNNTNIHIDTHDDNTYTAFSCVPNNDNDVTDDGVILSTTKKKTERKKKKKKRRQQEQSIITNYAMKDINHTVKLNDDADDNDNDNEDDGIIKVKKKTKRKVAKKTKEQQHESIENTIEVINTQLVNDTTVRGKKTKKKQTSPFT